jgi:hypothetical protein
MVKRKNDIAYRKALGTVKKKTWEQMQGALIDG